MSWGLLSQLVGSTCQTMFPLLPPSPAPIFLMLPSQIPSDEQCKASLLSRRQQRFQAWFCLFPTPSSPF